MTHCDRCHQPTLQFSPELRALRCQQCEHTQAAYQKWVFKNGVCDVSIQASDDADEAAIACTRIAYESLTINYSPFYDHSISVTCSIANPSALRLSFYAEINGVLINAIVASWTGEALLGVRVEFDLLGLVSAHRSTGEIDLNGRKAPEETTVITRFRSNPPTPKPFTKPETCNGCSNYHGQVYNGTPLICGMHPYGYEGEKCPDWEEKREPKLLPSIATHSSRPDYWILNGHTPVPCYSLDEWDEWFRSADRRVALDEVAGKRVSTVFLGLDHSFDDISDPVLFETMVFSGGSRREDYAQHYCTWEEAEAGHQEIVAELRNSQGDDLIPPYAP